MRAITKRNGDTIGLAIAAMLTAAACGGGVAGGDTRPDPTPPVIDTTTPPPPPPPPPFDATTCGDGGGRMTGAFCGSATRQVPCDLGWDAGADSANAIRIDPATCKRLCLSTTINCEDKSAPAACNRLQCDVRAVAGGGRELNCFDACPGGRRPEGYGGERSTADSSLGRTFARLAQLESVSISAFRRLAHELTRLGLPRELAVRAKEAQRDEVRHARDTWALARRFGAAPTRLGKMPGARARTILELALENAEEGCVREAYGAVVAAHQARAAADPEVRRVMETIAHDEAAHAELAFAIHDVIVARLSNGDRAQVQTALHSAWAALERDLAHAENDDDLRTQAGLPDRAAAFAGFRALERALSERLAEAA